MHFEASAHGGATTPSGSARAFFLRLLKPPVFAVPEQTRIAWVLHYWLLAIIIVSLLIGLLNLYVSRVNLGPNSLTYGVAALLAAGLMRVLRTSRHVHGIAHVLVFGSIAFTALANLTALRPFSIATSASYIVILLAGVVLTRRNYVLAVLTVLASTLIVSAYWMLQRRVAINPDLLAFDTMVHLTYAVAVACIVGFTTGQLRRALRTMREGREMLDGRQRELEREIEAHTRSESRQKRLTDGLHAMLEVNAELSACSELHEFWASAARLANTKLGLSRCGIYARVDHQGEWFGPEFDAVDTEGATIRRELNAIFDELAADVTTTWRARAQNNTPWRQSCHWVIDTRIVGAQNELLGAIMNTGANKGATPDPVQQDLIRIYAAMLGQIAGRKRLEAENARLHAERVRLASVKERSRLSRELHDSVSQSLFGIVLGVRTILQNGLRNDAINARALEFVFKQSETVLAEMRALIHALRPEMLESEGLLIALGRQLQSLFERSSMSLHIDLGTVEPELDIAGKEALYRIGMEAAHNVLKHAHATRLEVRLHVDATHVELIISDNGSGFVVDADHGDHYGLKTMRERAEYNNGSLSVHSVPGEGTTIVARLPVSGTADTRANRV